MASHGTGRIILAILTRAGAAAGLMLWLAGCISAPTPTDTTAPWTPPARARQTDRVWPGVRAHKPDFSGPLTLAELADIGLQNNPISRKAWNEARAAAAQVEQARGYFMPTLTGVAGGTRQYLTAQPDSFKQDYLKFNPGLQVSYLIFNFGGGRRAAVEQALQTVYSADFHFNRTIQDILLAVEVAYYDLVSAQADVAATESSVKDAQTALEAAKDRQAAGVGIELDVLQAQASYDRSLYNLAGAQGRTKIASGTLALALGVPADTAIQVTVPAIDVPETFSQQDLQRLIDESLPRRPDLAALRATLAAKEAAVKVAGSPLWPSLYANGSMTYDDYDTYGGLPFQDNDWTYVGGLSLQWTLFDGLQTLSAKRVARAQAEALRDQLKQAELLASSEVWSRFHNYETALRKYTFSEAYLKSSAAAYDLALDSYKAGVKSILDLLTAETQLAQARSQHIGARQEAFTALAHLAYATGLLARGGVAKPLNLFATPDRKDNQP